MSILKMILKIIDLKTWFPTKDGLVKAVNTVLDTGANDKVGLIGETGCGKTILCLSIIRLLPPSTKIEGAIVRQRPSKVERRRDEEDKGKGDYHDTPEPNDFAESGFESDQIAEAIQLHQGLDKRDAREKAIEMLESVRIPSPERRANEYPHQFSGGMKERAMIAMALACNPSISQMNQQRDVTIKTQVKLIKEVTVRKSMLFITHDLGVASQICDNIAVMLCGRARRIRKNRRYIQEPNASTGIS